MISSMEYITASALADRFAVSTQFILNEARRGHLTRSLTSSKHFTAQAVAVWSFNRAAEIQLASEAEEWSWATGTQQTLLDVPRAEADALGHIYRIRKLIATVDAILEHQPEHVDFDTLIRELNTASRLLRSFAGEPFADLLLTTIQTELGRIHDGRLALGALRRERERISTAPDS